jgi:hypothetical protein
LKEVGSDIFGSFCILYLWVKILMLRPNIKPPVVSQHWWFDVFIMISINQFKKILGKDAEGLDDNQIKDIHAAMYTFADATIENWIQKGKPSRMFMYDLADPTFMKVILWYPTTIKAII